MPPAGDLQRCQPQRGQRAGGGIHANLRIEHHVRSILRYLIQPAARRLWALYESIDLVACPARLGVGDRTGVVEKDLELAPIHMLDDAAQDHVPYRVLPHLPAHHDDADAIARRFNAAITTYRRLPE